jgi:DNA-binding transcriptional MerR regulator
MRAGLTIGEFASMTHLSVRTLRRYHDSGLLEPAEVDASTGYRYYTAGQIPVAQVIYRLRELDVPLADVRAILASADPPQRATLVENHLERLEHELDRTRAAVASLRQLLHPDQARLDVELTSLSARTVCGIRLEVTNDANLTWYDLAMAELEAEFPPAERVGAPGGQYANELFTEGHGAALVYWPVHQPRSHGRIEIAELPAIELASVVHHGDHDSIDVTYGRLGAWVVEHALAVQGMVQETYLVGPRDTPDATLWRTEIGWPIFRIAAP